MTHNPSPELVEAHLAALMKVVIPHIKDDPQPSLRATWIIADVMNELHRQGRLTEPWREIESASKDRPIMLYTPDNYVKVSQGWWVQGDPGGWVHISDDGYDTECIPTHWKPLDSTPSEEG